MARGRGFTLVELLVVLAILGFIVALVGPLTADRIDKARAQEEWLMLDRTVRGLAFKAFADGREVELRGEGGELRWKMAGSDERSLPLKHLFFDHGAGRAHQRERRRRPVEPRVAPGRPAARARTERLAGGRQVKRQRGFTLLEVLIAATILFTVLAVATETYRNALLASSRAEGSWSLLTPLPLITSSIRSQLRSNPVEKLDGRSELLGVSYEWQAATIRYGAPPRRFDPDATDFISYQPRFRLYDVRLKLRRAGQERAFLYQEVAWEAMRR